MEEMLIRKARQLGKNMAHSQIFQPNDAATEIILARLKVKQILDIIESNRKGTAMGTWQKLVDKAYKTWNSNQTYWQFIKNLTDKEKTAVILANLNYQIENGGLSQWLDNKYYKPEVLEEIDKIGTDISKQLSRRLKALVATLEDDYHNDTPEYDERTETSSTFDAWYYSINEQLKKDIEEYFQGPRKYVITITTETEPFLSKTLYTIIVEAKNREHLQEQERKILRLIKPLCAEKVTSNTTEAKELQQLITEISQR